jgi:stage III sporulation protein AD
MAEIIKVIGVAFVTALTALLLRSTKPELSFAVTVTGVIVILLFIVNYMKITLVFLTEISGMTGLDNGLIKILLKIVGIGYLTEFSAGILNDFGSNAVADKVILAGKLTMLFLAIPVIKTLLQLMKGFLGLV